jgi:cytochrome c oxidase subunit II
MVTYFWFTPTRTAKFDVLCFELCGTGHYTMRGSVVVEDEAAFKTWLSQQTAFRDTQQPTRMATKNASDVR